VARANFQPMGMSTYKCIYRTLAGYFRDGMDRICHRYINDDRHCSTSHPVPLNDANPSPQERRSRQRKGILAKLGNFINRRGRRNTTAFANGRDAHRNSHSPRLRSETLRGVNSFFGTPAVNQYTITPRKKYVSFFPFAGHAVSYVSGMRRSCGRLTRSFLPIHSRIINSSTGLIVIT
jgi:hypothetical protein